MNKTYVWAICPVCNTKMKVGRVDEKVVAMCENEKCLSVLVYGDPVQKVFTDARKLE